MKLALLVVVCISLTLSKASFLPNDELSRMLTTHVRILDSGGSHVDSMLPFSSRQTGNCTSSTNTFSPKNCGRFKCDFCTKNVVCQAERVVERPTERFTISCKTLPCSKSADGRTCCGREFTVERRCIDGKPDPIGVLPDILDPIILPPDAKPGVTLPDILTTIKIPDQLDADIYLLTDTTGSMTQEINAVKTSIINIIDQIKGIDGTSVTFGLGEFRDETELDGGFRHIQSLTFDKTVVQTAADKLSVRGGGDLAEAGLVALYRVATEKSIGWRRNARKIVVLYGDAPQHEPTCYKGKKFARTEVIKALKEEKIAVVAVSFAGALDRNPLKQYNCEGTISDRLSPITGQGTKITTDTSGVITTLPANPPADSVRKTIIDLFNKTPLKLGFEPGCDLISIEFSPPISSFSDLKRGQVIKLKQKVTISPDICPFGIADCKNTFTVSGPNVATQVVQVNKNICF